MSRESLTDLVDGADTALFWSVARAADLLSIRRTTLVEKMRKFGIVRK